MITINEAYKAMLLVCGLGIVIDALERFSTIRKYRDDGLYSWTLARQRFVGVPMPIRMILDGLLAGLGPLVVVLGFRIIAVGVVVASPVASATWAAGLTTLVATHLLISLRTGGAGTIGADPMTLVICGGALLGTSAATTDEAARAGLWFVALQACLGYVVAGVAKLSAPKWRSGSAIQSVLSTFTYGNSRLHGYLSRRPRLSMLVCWAVMLWEATFPIVLVVPRGAVWPLLGVGIIFHLQLAALMGLNLFLFAFPATYAAILAVRG